MKMVALPSGKQRSIHGPAVNVPSKVDNICNVLPRLPSQTELVPLKLKRKVAYRGHYMYDYITPQKPLDALKFSKTNNPLYADIDINEQWFEEALTNDEQLGRCLFEQNDGDMDTECEYDNNCANGSNTDIPVGTMNTESESSMESCSNSDVKNVVSVALHELELLANQNGFTIHHVPYDGNCMFSAISYQLQNTGVCNVDSNELRQMLANYLEANTALYCDFPSQPVISHDDYNADTEPPTAEDEYINIVANPQLQIQLRWQKYLRCLRKGAWGDHITIQGIADMLSVKVSVISSHTQCSQ